MTWWFLGGVAVLLLALAVWWIWQVTRPESSPQRGAAPTRPAASDAEQAAELAASRAKARRAVARRQRADDRGPETVLSYLNFQHSEPVPSDYGSGFHSDFGPSSLPPDDPVLADQRRIEKALRDLQDGPADKAWERLKGFHPDSEQAAALSLIHI